MMACTHCRQQLSHVNRYLPCPVRGRVSGRTEWLGHAWLAAQYVQPDESEYVFP